MGCDIHLHIEIKIGETWHHYNHPRIQRNYDLFAKMAGVRNRDDFIDPISTRKGLPDDISFTTKFDAAYRGADWHSHSFLESREIAQLAKWCRKQFGYDWFDDTFGFLFGNSLYSFPDYPDSYPEEIESVRFVFWFDN